MIAPGSVRKVIDDGSGKTTRRIEIFESDGLTMWQQDVGDRLLTGSVSVTYGDNERRTVDLQLRNTDNLLRSQPSGFWYDKVIKVYRGVSFVGELVLPTTAIIEAVGGEPGAFRMAGTLAKAGAPDAQVRLTAGNSYAELLGYDIIVSHTGTNSSEQAFLLQELFNAGKSIITVSSANGMSVIPYFDSTVNISEQVGISQTASSSTLSTGWTTESAGIATGPFPTALQGGATPVSRWQLANSTYVFTASTMTNKNGGKWFDLHLPSVSGVNTNILFANAVKWIRGIGGTQLWETQIGEFVIDSISGDYFPSSVKVTGRDYVKKCANSKIESAMSFGGETPVYTLVRALAANAGITKFRMAPMTESIGNTMTFERGTPRWDVMREAAQAHGYEIYFDAEGYLVTRKFLDPTLSPESNVFLTGPRGNLSTLNRVVNDSRIYNHISVYGDPASGEARLPYFAEAKNTNPSSPTSVAKIGDRYYSFASTFFTSQQQCQDYANRLLSITALESFQLSFNSINYPWMEVGEIARVVDPRAVATDPTKYLVDTLSIPLDLGAMSVTGKRITIVG